MFQHTLISTVAALLTLTACSPGSKNTGEDTDGQDTEGVDTDDTVTGGDAPECDEMDPAVNAAFTLTLAGWPGQEVGSGADFDVPCTVAAVNAAGATVATELSCIVDGAQHPATLAIAAAPEGAVVWKAADSVRLVYIDIDEGDLGQQRAVQLRAGADDALLVSGDDSFLDEVVRNRFKPLTVELALACGTSDEGYPVRVDFTPAEGPTLGIFSGHRGLLPISAKEGFAIDVAQAEGVDLHGEGTMKILLRRVATGA